MLACSNNVQRSRLPIALDAELIALKLDHNLMDDAGMGSLAGALAGGLSLEELYVECNPASEAATRRVLEHFDDAGDDAQRPPDPGNTCERISVSLHQAGCVCQ